MLMDKEEEENIKRCESCLQILDPETPLPSVKLLSAADILKSNFVNEKQAVLNPKVSIDNTLDKPSIDIDYACFDVKYNSSLIIIIPCRFVWM